MDNMKKELVEKVRKFGFSVEFNPVHTTKGEANLLNVDKDGLWVHFKPTREFTWGFYEFWDNLTEKDKETVYNNFCSSINMFC